MSWSIPHVLQDDLEYEITLWGELIRGTREAIQHLGIGVGMAFPGEPGAPTKRKMSLRDPRGFDCLITRREGDSLPYCASIHLPGREYDEKRLEDFAPGVRKSSEIWWCDEYIGTGDALASAGLISFDKLPGQPGMGKVSVAIFPDGTISPSGCSRKETHQPGAKQIARAGNDRYRLRIVAPEDEQSRRHEAYFRARNEWEVRMHAMPRPAPLIAFPDEPRETTRARHMARLRVVDGIRYTFEETTPTLPKPQYRTEGNVIHFPRAAGGLEARP